MCQGSRTMLATLALASAVAAGGCGGAIRWWTAPQGAEVTVEGLGNRPGELASELPISVYAVRPAEETHWSSDRSLEELAHGDFDSARFLHVQLLWEPIAGKTSIASTATNVVARLVIVSGDEIGVYAGGGFAWPWGDPGDDDRTLVITGSSLSLIARTEGFVDLLSPAEITGTVVSRHDPDGTVRWRRAVSQIVTNRLDEAQWVDGSGRPMDRATAAKAIDGESGPA